MRQPEQVAKELQLALADGRISLRKRVELVAAQLELGWPHALEVEPNDFELYRTHNALLDRAATGWRIATGALAFASASWCGLWCCLVFSGLFAPKWPLGLPFVIGALHAGLAGVAAAHSPSARSTQLLHIAAWLGWAGPLLALLCFGYDTDKLAGGLLCALPSMLVAWAAGAARRALDRKSALQVSAPAY